MRRTELAVTLTFSAGEHATIETQIEELTTEIAEVTGRLDGIDERVQEIRRRTGLPVDGGERRPSLRSVAPEQVARSTLSW